MKVGTSLSRCVRDIVLGNVDINDVLVIIARTNVDPHDDGQWQNIWHGYRERSGWSAPEWAEFTAEQEDQVRSVTIELYETGKLHQPRQFGFSVSRVHYHWLETILIEDDLAQNPAAKDAWQQFQIVAGLSNIKISTNIE